ncbi:E3 ubiquitin-protein ligase BIG BROTHER-like [Impatiens glandulifera]|uniref:E3 ubiquitin-protein ligase BIG BROTHER-like n=1 Tax=Impatiens glandulifera TaxID=253017 RepID=UPI001FB0C89F|nr:E3 ubiquitin-protein ligase BIG BROTHER-like [Impatiens glandulifera]XP_047329567.1 E3 ubiquitin-protein ligase BIG BROTHER-like [Impatiens glandulifera]
MMRNGGGGPSNANGIPPGVLEKMMELCPEYGDLDYDELLEHQESVYQSLKGIESSSSTKLNKNDELIDSQLALDEALAIALQDMENQLEHFSLYSSSSTEHENGPSQEPNNHVHHHHHHHPEEEEQQTAATVGADHVGEDGIDPDNMSYEELQSLGEAVGTENRGLSKKAISKLKTTKFGSSSSGGGGRWLFKKQTKEKEEEEKEKDCPICCMAYKEGEKLTILPCKHLYHTHCINTWLMKRKNCPLCKREIH